MRREPIHRDDVRLRKTQLRRVLDGGQVLDDYHGCRAAIPGFRQRVTIIAHVRRSGPLINPERRCQG